MNGNLLFHILKFLSLGEKVEKTFNKLRNRYDCAKKVLKVTNLEKAVSKASEYASISGMDWQLR